MDIYEEAVQLYITSNQNRFVNPQFDIPFKDGAGGSCPDFVVIDYSDKTIFIVEVTTSSNQKTIIERVDEREMRWYIQVKSHMTTLDPAFADWAYHTTLFIRQENYDKASLKFSTSPDVSIFIIEEIMFPWSWNWNNASSFNPLRNP